MKILDISKYALMLENRAFVSETAADTAAATVTATMAAKTAIVKAAAKSLATPVETDTPGLKAIKAIINDPTAKKAEYDSIINQLEPFILSTDANLNTRPLKFKDGTIDYEVSVNRQKDPNGNFAVWFDEDGTKILIQGLDMNYLAIQFRKGVEGSSIFGLTFGTDEDKLAALAGAIHKTAAENNADPKAVFDALNTTYTALYREGMYEALDGEFSGSPDAFARALYGQELTDGDIRTALGVDFLQSLVFDVALGMVTFGAFSAARGLLTGARAIRAAGAVNKITGASKAFRSGLAGNATGVGIPGSANVGALSAGAVNRPLAQSGFSAITAAGNTARTGGTIGAATGGGLAAAGGISSATSDVDTNVNSGGQQLDPESAAFAYCVQIRELAKGYTDSADEFQIAFMILALDRQTVQVVLRIWEKNFSDKGSFYEYCVSSELGGDLRKLVNGYWAGITGSGPLADEVAKISVDMKKGAATPESGAGDQA